MSDKKIIINADDFGLSPGTNKAIEQLLNTGAITSATLMVNGPEFESAVDSILTSERHWAIGLHVNVTQFSPVGTGDGLDALIDNKGQFRGRSALIRAWLTGRVSEDAIADEIRLQFDACIEKGVKIDHMDSHQHAHAVPVVNRAMSKVAKEKGVPTRVLKPYIQNPSWKRMLKAKVLNWVTNRANNDKKGGLANNMTLASIFSTELLPSVMAYSELLACCPSQLIELMVHPADVDVAHSALTRISDISQQDYDVLSSPEWSEFQRNCGYKFVTFSEIG